MTESDNKHHCVTQSSPTNICVHGCNEKRSSSKIILSWVSNQKLISSLVKYFSPQDTKTISLQNNWKLMPGIYYNIFVLSHDITSWSYYTCLIVLFFSHEYKMIPIVIALFPGQTAVSFKKLNLAAHILCVWLGLSPQVSIRASLWRNKLWMLGNFFMLLQCSI